MTPRAFCQSGACEFGKGAVHGAAALLFFGMAFYNGASFWFRREARLGSLSVLYASLCAFEVQKTLHHWAKD